MRLNHLRYFLVLARLEHYTEAAEELSITQPTLSNSISLLERELGIPLFEKKGRNVILTKYGEIFAGEVKKLLTDFDSIKSELKEIGDGEGLIDLAFLQTLGTHFIPKMVRGFIDDNKDKKYRFRFCTGANTTQDLLKGLREGRYDIAICSKIKKEPNIEFTPVAKQELIVIVPLNHPLARHDAIDLEKTTQYPQLIFSHSSGLRSVVDELFERLGLDYVINHEIENDQVMAGFVSQGFGIAVVPNMPILDHLNVKVIKIKNCDTDRFFYLATRNNSYLSPAAKAFKKFAIQNAQL